MKLATPRSPKFRRLMRVTGLSRIETAGTLELLWLFTMEQSPAGDIGRWTDEEIEAELDWEGEPGALVRALVETRWLDRDPVHRLIVHDWADHLPDFMRKRVQRGHVELVRPAEPPSEPEGHESGEQDPSPDTVATQSGHCDDSGGLPREGKPREAKGREGGSGGNPPSADARSGDSDPPEKPKRSRAKPRTPVPAELPPEVWAQVRDWARRRDPPLDEHALRYAWGVFVAKARAGEYRYADHGQAFRNALGAAGEAWALNGYKPPRQAATVGDHKPTARQLEARRKLNAAALEQGREPPYPDLEPTANGPPEDSTHVANLIDMSLKRGAQ